MTGRRLRVDGQDTAPWISSSRGAAMVVVVVVVLPAVVVEWYG